MDHEQFEERLGLAERLYEISEDPDETLYWCGFSRGLRRAYLGRRFSSDTDHFAWLAFREDSDRCVSELGRGYRAGLGVVISGRAEN